VVAKVTRGDEPETHLATGLGIRACQAGHRVLFATAAEWVDRLGEAHSAGRLHDELRRLLRTPLLVIDLYRPWDYADHGGARR
jgi:DNA replication protein DnaC